jgi:AcrR family transcriptional regulator
MSVGHIYRYFAGKDEIIGAIVQRKLDEVTSRFVELERSSGNLYQALIGEVEHGVAIVTDPEHAALMVEIRAEAGRNPEIAAIVQAADRTLRQHLARVLVRAGAPDWTDADVEARVELMALIFEGIPLRTIANPELDHAALTAMIRRTIQALFAPEA